MEHPPEEEPFRFLDLQTLRNFSHFRAQYLVTTPGDTVLAILLAVFVAWYFGASAGPVVQVLLTWFVVSGCFFFDYAYACLEQGHLGLTWLPWRRGWTWLFLLFTLLWLPFWLVSAVRLIGCYRYYKRNKPE